ncbi:hypothetical protein J3U37_02870 [Gilliamella sp. B3172]|nr:hypothetical protein [Gilliamella sp. B3172]MCX8639033.1 hypothetical protein [Gilliamella sp. B3172]
MKEISILDTTLSARKLVPQNAMNTKQKFKLVLELEALGVNHIEKGFTDS